jgi:hypothetical protein
MHGNQLGFDIELGHEIAGFQARLVSGRAAPIVTRNLARERLADNVDGRWKAD